MKEYRIHFAEETDKDLHGLAWMLGTDEGEIIRRAIELFKNAANADTVLLIKNGAETKVLIK